MKITLQVFPTTCQICLTNAGVDAVIDFTKRPPTVLVEDAQIATFKIWNATPPPAHNHAVATNTDSVAASDAWVQLNTHVAMLPPVPARGQDLYAALRSRLASQLVAAATKVANTGDGKFH